MRRENAQQVVLMLNAAFVATTLDVESADIYVEELALLADAGVALEAATMIVRQADRFPTIAEFRRVYRSVAEHRQASQPKLEEPRSEEKPTWVYVWHWCRQVKKDWRWFPQQAGNETSGEPVMSTEDYAVAHGEWQTAGSPLPKSVGEMLRVKGG